jgi:hypothetical protein
LQEGRDWGIKDEKMKGRNRMHFYNREKKRKLYNGVVANFFPPSF